MEIYMSIVLAGIIGLYFIYESVKLKKENKEITSNLVRNDRTIKTLKNERLIDNEASQKQILFLEKEVINMKYSRDYYKRKAYKEEAIILLNKICTETENKTHIKEINKYIFNLKKWPSSKN